MNRQDIAQLPELAALYAGGGSVRIPPEQDVPLTPRVRRILDTAAFRRLGEITQLGLVRLVYPAARHSRLEHSLGVYRLALQFLARLQHDRTFSARVDMHAAGLLVVTGLLHDVGHWPFCHPLEDMRLSQVPKHEARMLYWLEQEELGSLLRRDWGVAPADVAGLLNQTSSTPGAGLLQGILSGPLDIDKMDYLQRDSLHAGVPYGRNFDQNRLIASLCSGADGNGLAITDKGKTAAEMMVFARYVMFSEVYWHHAVRSATAMLQRAHYLLQPYWELSRLWELGEFDYIQQVFTWAEKSDPECRAVQELWSGLFGPQRGLYKRCGQYSFVERPDIHAAVGRRPYAWLTRCAEHLASLLAAELKLELPPHYVLVDAPPVDREVEFKVDVLDHKSGVYRPLEQISPVVRALAREQFDDYVKRVRIFAHPTVAARIANAAALDTWLLKAAALTTAELTLRESSG